MEALWVAGGALIGYWIGARRRMTEPRNEVVDATMSDPPIVAATKSQYPLRRHAPELQAKLRIVLENFGPQFPRCAPVRYPPPPGDDRVKYAIDVARSIGRRYGIPLHRVHFRFAKRLPGAAAGQFRATNENTYIDVLERFRDDDGAIVGILAHEMAHCALEHKGLQRGSRQEIEELTDSLCVIAGYGPLMLESNFRQHKFVENGQVGTQMDKIGYLHPSAVAYLTMLQARLCGDLSSPAIDWTSPWMREPAELWDSALSQRLDSSQSAMSAMPTCLVCLSILPQPEIGTQGRSTCKCCLFTQPFPAALRAPAA